jgi:DNA-binding IclR family transcriptional regulator
MGRYRPTMRIVALAGQVIERSPLIENARPHVEQLRSELGESCHLSVPSYVSALCLVHASGSRDGTAPRLRELVPCHCTAGGKALLAWREQWREAVLAQPLERFTQRTATGPMWLRRDLHRTVERGYSVEDCEFDPETRAVAAPVVCAGEVVAALAVAAPISRLSTERVKPVGETVVGAAAALSVDIERSRS